LEKKSVEFLFSESVANSGAEKVGEQSGQKTEDGWNGHSGIRRTAESRKKGKK